MNVLKIALLGTAALAAVSVSARADDLSDLKAQIEALNGRIASLEATPAVPAGYQLLTVSETTNVILPGGANDRFFGKTGTQIGIMPTADVPASTNIVWTGYVSAAATYGDVSTGDFDLNGDGDVLDAGEAGTDADFFDIQSKAGLNVTATTDTAVGEVGVSITMLANARATYGGTNRGHDASVATDGFRGWWKITPELELSGGVFGSAAKNGKDWDANCNCYYAGFENTVGGGVYGTNAGNDAAQIRLTYSSGPLSMAIAVEDYDNNGVSSRVGVAGEAKWSGDTFGFELAGGYWDSVAAEANWTVNAGASFGLGDMATLSLSAGVGEDQHVAGNSDQYMKVTGFANFSMTDAVNFQLGAAYKDYKGAAESWAVGGGIYYVPVSQLTLGLEADYTTGDDFIGRDFDVFQAALVTRYSF